MLFLITFFCYPVGKSPGCWRLYTFSKLLFCCSKWIHPRISDFTICTGGNSWYVTRRTIPWITCHLCKFIIPRGILLAIIFLSVLAFDYLHIIGDRKKENYNDQRTFPYYFLFLYYYITNLIYCVKKMKEEKEKEKSKIFTHLLYLFSLINKGND